jgi:8-oxo-dGTP diphosphatase
VTGVQVTAGVLSRGDRILACQRARGTLHASKWEFPGGKVEPGETLQECLRRELEEELGIHAVIGRRLWEGGHTYPGRGRITLTFFAISAYEGVLTNLVFEEIRWVRVADLKDIDFLEADREFVERLVNREIRL